MRSIDRFTVRKGSEVGSRIRYRVRRGFFWYLGFVLGFLGVKS